MLYIVQQPLWFCFSLICFSTIMKAQVDSSVQPDRAGVSPQAMLCPEIHGDSGLDSLAGGSLLPGNAVAANRQYARAVPRMFEVISRHYADR